METFDKQKYSSLLVQGNLQDTIKYLQGFSEKAELIEKYMDVFIKTNPCQDLQIK